MLACWPEVVQAPRLRPAHSRHQAACRPAVVPRATAAGRPAPAASGSLITLEEVQQAARNRGLCISVRDLGPFYRIVCREGNEQGRILALTTGFVAPLFGLMHCDTLQVFTRGLKGDEGQRVRGGVLGLGLLVGGAVFAYGLACGCAKAEILAINDDDATHARLVRYYRYFGFEPVAEVGTGTLADIPHMLVWGGRGTRMDADMAAMVARWTPALRRAAAAAGEAGNEGGDGTGS